MKVTKVDSLKRKGGIIWKLIYPAVVLISVLALTFMTATPVMAANVNYESYMTGEDSSLGFTWHWEAQTFTTTSAHTVVAVSLKLQRDSGYTGTITVSITATDTNGYPTGGDLCSGTIPASSIPTSNGWATATMTSSYFLRNNTKYAVVVKGAYPSGSGFCWWDFDGDHSWDTDGTTYAGGSSFKWEYRWSPPGNYWSPYIGDFMFQIQGEPTAVINEFVIDHVGDDTHQFLEIYAQPSTDYSAWSLLQVEGDSGENPGNIDKVYTAGTTNSSGFWTTDFLNQQLENGNSTILLVQGFTGAEGNDLDTNDDGTLESKPWTNLVDAVAITAGDAGGQVYSSVVLSNIGGASRISNGKDTETIGDWVVNDFDGAGLPEFTGTPIYGEAYNTPGAANALVPQVINYALTVATNPSNIDSTTGSGNYAPGATVSISAPENVDIVAGQSRYHFTDWSGATVANPASASTNIIMPANAATVTANYVTQYYLTVNDGGHGTAGGAGWYTAGTYAQATITPLMVDVDAGTRYVFSGWSGNASGSGSPSNNIYMDGAKTATATWTTQHFLTVNTNPADIDSPTGQGWYNEGAIAHVSTTEDVDIWADSSRYHFNSWTGASGTFSDATVTLDTAKTATANYITQFKLKFDAVSPSFDIKEHSTETIVTFNGSGKTASELLFTTDWINNGTSISYEFASVVNATAGAKYEWVRNFARPAELNSRTNNNFVVSTYGSAMGAYRLHSVTVSPITQQYSDNVTFTAEMDYTSLLPPPMDVHFYIGNQDMGSALVSRPPSGSKFVGSLNVSLLESVGGQMAAGNKVVTAKWDNLDAPLNPTTSLTITKEDANINYTGDTGLMLTAGPTINTATIRLSAHVEQLNDGFPGDITKATIDFLIYQGSSVSGTPIIVGNVPVDAAGNALTTKQLTADQWCVIAVITPANGYWTSTETSDPVLITVNPGTGSQMITGGGWVSDSLSANGKANFGFIVRYQKKGDPKGNSLLLFRGTDGNNYLVKSSAWNGGGLTFYSGSKASFSAKCVIQKIDRVTGLVTESIGNCAFTADIIDGDMVNPKSSDNYGITVLGQNGLVWHQIGTVNSPIDIGGGNVIVHSK